MSMTTDKLLEYIKSLDAQEFEDLLAGMEQIAANTALESTHDPAWKALVRLTELNMEYCRIGKLLSKTASAIDAVRHAHKLSKADSRALRSIELDCIGHGGFLARLECLSRAGTLTKSACGRRRSK